MTDKLSKIIVDCSLPESHPDKVKIIPLTDEEIAEREAQAAQYLLEVAAREQAEAEKLALRESAKEKLAALGLSTDEVSALLGA